MKAWLKRRLTGLCYGYLRGQPDWAHEKSPEVRHALFCPWPTKTLRVLRLLGGTRMLNEFVTQHQGDCCVHSLSGNAVQIKVSDHGE